MSQGLPGWVSIDGELQAAESVADYALRRQTVKGVCNTRECRRRIELDPQELCARGMGQLSMTQVQRLWKCLRLDHCSLDFHREKPLNPLRLGQLVGRPNVRVRIRCRGNGCKFFRVWRVEEMIAGLTKRRQGDNTTPVDELGPKMTSGCPMCKKTNWTAEVLWVDTDTMGWRARGEGAFTPSEAGG